MQKGWKKWARKWGTWWGGKSSGKKGVGWGGCVRQERETGT